MILQKQAGHVIFLKQSGHVILLKTDRSRDFTETDNVVFLKQSGHVIESRKQKDTFLLLALKGFKYTQMYSPTPSI